MTVENPRGYAYATLRYSYARINSWDWGYAAKGAGHMPSLYEYIEDGLNMYDAFTCESDDDYKEIVFTIVKEMNRSITELGKGLFGYPTDENGRQYIEHKYDTILDVVVQDQSEWGDEITVGDSVLYTEVGYGRVEDADLMRARLRMIATKLRPEDYDVLISYVSGEYDDIKAAAGGTYQAWAWTKRTRAALRQFADLDLFTKGT